MQIKKRAKSVKFGKKDEASELKKDENSMQHTNAGDEKQEQVKDEEEGVMSERTSEQVNQEEIRIPASQNEEGVKESPENTVVENEPAGIDSDIKEEVKEEEEVQLKTPQNIEVPNDPESSENDNNYVVQSEVKKNMLGYFIVIAAVSFLIGLISMYGISLIFSKTFFTLPFGKSKVAVISLSPKPKVAIEPTKVQEVNPAEYSIEILNGSEIKGGASRLKTALTTAGFDVLSAGNADNSDYTDTIISAKKSVNAAYIEKLRVELKKSYILDTKTKVLADETSEADVIIAIGSKVSSNFE